MKRSVMMGIMIVACTFGGYRRPSVLASSPRLSFDVVSGNWFGHGRDIYVAANGQGIAHFRTYADCSRTVTTNCDMFARNSIYPGGYFSFTLNHVSGNKAFGSISNSGYSWMIGTSITIARNANDSVHVYVLRGYGVYCGSNAPVGYCGA